MFISIRSVSSREIVAMDWDTLYMYIECPRITYYTVSRADKTVNEFLKSHISF